jgi:hypothetical protein
VVDINKKQNKKMRNGCVLLSETISHFFIPNFFLVPIHRTTRIASLIPFQSIGQHTGGSTNTEVIGSKGTEYQATAHIETVQVTADIDRCH